MQSTRLNFINSVPGINSKKLDRLGWFSKMSLFIKRPKFLKFTPCAELVKLDPSYLLYSFVNYSGKTKDKKLSLNNCLFGSVKSSNVRGIKKFANAKNWKEERTKREKWKMILFHLVLKLRGCYFGRKWNLLICINFFTCVLNRNFVIRTTLWDLSF